MAGHLKFPDRLHYVIFTHASKLICYLKEILAWRDKSQQSHPKVALLKGLNLDRSLGKLRLVITPLFS